MLRPTTVKEAFLFAAQPENKPFAMAAMAAAGAVDQEWTRVTIEVAGDIFGEAMLARLHEWMPAIVAGGGVNGGHFGGAAPAEFLAAWESAMRDFKPGALDFTGWRAPLKKAAAPVDEDREEGIAALKRLTPVLNLGLDEGAGALIPTAHATARDLLGYGWEMAGLQFGERHNFLEDKLGDPAYAFAIATMVLERLKGAEVFFEGTTAKAAEPLREPARVQFQNALPAQRALFRNLPAAWRQAPDTWLRRTWLGQNATRESIESMTRADVSDDMCKAIVERLIHESGQRCLSPLHDRPVNSKRAATFSRLGLRAVIAPELPWMIEPQASLAWTSSDGHHLQYAQALEKLCWSNLVEVRTDSALLGYVEVNALDSAKRFYDRIIEFSTNQVGFSGTTGPERFIIAWWENDDAGMRRAIRDSATYSWSDLNLQATYAISRGDTALAGRIIDAMCERYTSGAKRDLAVKEFLLLLPALEDPTHADHAKAVASFPEDPHWQLAQWILLKRAKLTGEEAIRFLGKSTVSIRNKILIAYLKGDKGQFLEQYERLVWKGTDKMAVLYALLRAEMLGVPPAADLPNLMPAGAKPLVTLIREEARRARR